MDTPREIAPEKIAEYQLAFNLFDRDGDGSITITELETVLRSFGQNPTDDELAQMIKEVDKDGNGEIDFDEFLKMMSTKATSDENQVKDCFEVFDKNKTGFIEDADLAEVMTSLGEILSPEEINFMIGELDPGSQGKVSFADFEKMALGNKN